jgi:LCCL domain
MIKRANLLMAGFAAAALLAAILAANAQQGAPVPQAPPNCPNSFEAAPDRPLTCLCTAEVAAAQAAPVWGTDVYSDDSSICRAARHAGVIGPEGGAVAVTPAPGRASYRGTPRNGVLTMDWGPHHPRSFVVARPGEEPRQSPDQAGLCPGNFQGAPEQPMDCACSAETTRFDAPVWGTDVYSDDSSICRAALHAGAVGAEGGRVRVTPIGGLDNYKGEVRNGVTTLDWNSPHPRSFRVERAD